MHIQADSLNAAAGSDPEPPADPDENERRIAVLRGVVTALSRHIGGIRAASWLPITAGTLLIGGGTSSLFLPTQYTSAQFVCSIVAGALLLILGPATVLVRQRGVLEIYAEAHKEWIMLLGDDTPLVNVDQNRKTHVPLVPNFLLDETTASPLSEPAVGAHSFLEEMFDQAYRATAAPATIFGFVGFLMTTAAWLPLVSWFPGVQAELTSLKFVTLVCVGAVLLAVGAALATMPASQLRESARVEMADSRRPVDLTGRL